MTLFRPAIGLAVVLALAGGGWLWLRDSSLVQVRDVQITGATASDGKRVRAAIETAARQMTTLRVREDVLREAVAPYTSVDDLRVERDFPHGLRVQVIERRPVAALAPSRGGRRVPVTRDGVLLYGVDAERGLPSLKLRRGAVGAKLADRRALRALKVAAAAPEPLLRRSAEVSYGSRGVVVTLRNGPELVFGQAEDVDAKWRAAARVLAETSARGATYLDLRIPGRVAAGGLAPIVPDDQNPNPQLEGQNGITLE